MRPGIAPTPIDAQRTALVRIFPLTADWLTVMKGEATPTDISVYVARAEHSHESAEVRLSGYTAVHPGQLIEIIVDSVLAFRGQISEIRNWSAERGAASATLVARTREQHPRWKDIRYSTPAFPVGTQLTHIMRSILDAIGAQYELPAASTQVPHSNVQMADMTVWEMLAELCVPGLLAPQMGVDGVLRFYSRMAGRTHDWAIDTDRLVSVDGSNSGTPVSAVRLKWMAPELQKTVQQDQVVYRLSIYPNPLEIRQSRRVFYSTDRTGRAQHTYMKKIKSVNNPLIKSITEQIRAVTEILNILTFGFLGFELNDYMISPYATEHWYPDEETDLGGEFVVTLSLLKPLATIIGIVIWFLAFIAILSLQEGEYEIWGQPYDFVHAINTYEAYDEDAPDWLRNEVELRSDLIPNAACAATVAVHDLLFWNFQTTRLNVTMVDHLGIEVGDIIKLPDGARLFVEGFSRDVSRGAAALLKVQGFRC